MKLWPYRDPDTYPDDVRDAADLLIGEPPYQSPPVRYEGDTPALRAADPPAPARRAAAAPAVAAAGKAELQRWIASQTDPWLPAAADAHLRTLDLVFDPATICRWIGALVQAGTLVRRRTPHAHRTFVYLQREPCEPCEP